MEGILLTAADAGAGSGSNSMVILIIYVVAFGLLAYWLMVRPQKKEKERMESMLSSLAVGDTVLTTSGFYGTCIGIDDDTIVVEFGGNKNCRIPMKKDAIAQIEKPE